MNQKISKKLLTISIASALGLSYLGNVSADTIVSLSLNDTDGDTAISGFRFTTFTDTSFPSGTALSFGAPDEDCGGGPGSCNGGVIDFDIGEISPMTFTTGFNFGGTGDFMPAIQDSTGTGNASGTISIDENGTHLLDLTALDFSGLFNGTTFFLPPEDLSDITGDPADEGEPAVPTDPAFSASSTIPIILQSLTSNNDGTFDAVLNFSSFISQGSTFDGNLSRWRIEGTFSVTDSAPLVFISGAGGASGDYTSNVAPNMTYADQGAVCQDVVDGEITPLVDVASLPAPLPADSFYRVDNNPNSPDTGDDGSLFTVDYTCTDSQGNTSTATRTVEVGEDTEPPTITLGVATSEPGRSDSPDGTTVDILVGKTYIDASATCEDNRDGNIPLGSANFTVTPDPPVVDTSVPSTGNVITFSCDDVAGNGPTIAERTVNVLADTVKPVITLENPDPRTISVGSAFDVPLTPPQVACTDTNPIDTIPVDISSNLDVSLTSVDTSTPGMTLITYDCSDASGNAADTVTLEVNVVSGQSYEILSMTVADVDGDLLAGCFRFIPPTLDPNTCNNSNRFATDSSTIVSLADPSSETIPGVGSDVDSNGNPIGIRFGEFQAITDFIDPGFQGNLQPVGPISPGFNFTGFPFVPFTFDPPSESADPPRGFVTVSGSTRVLTIESLPFAGRYQSNKPNDFFLDPDEGTLAVLNIVDNNDDNGTTRTFNYLITWSHFITSAEDPTGTFDGFRAAWRMEGVITANSTPFVLNGVPQINNVTARQGSNDPTSIIVNTDGLVTARVEATDPDTGDTLSYDWNASNVTAVGPTNGQEFTFDPASLENGLLSLRVTVTDDASEPLSASAKLLLQVVDAAPVLEAGIDTDGDGIDDLTEGFGDSDNDGLPDYRDPVGLAATENRRSFDAPSEGNLVSSAGRLRLGPFAFSTAKDSFIVTENDIGASDKLNQIAGVQHSGGGIADFEVWGLQPGDPVSVVIPQSVPLPKLPLYRKYTEDKGWFTFSAVSGNALASAESDVNGDCPGPDDAAYDTPVDASGNTFLVEGDDCVRVTVVDGSSMDGDNLKNGIVQDPGTPAANGPVPIGEKPESFLEGGGCSIVGHTVYFSDRMDWLLVALFWLYLGYRKIKQQT